MFSTLSRNEHAPTSLSHRAQCICGQSARGCCCGGNSDGRLAGKVGAECGFVLSPTFWKIPHHLLNYALVIYWTRARWYNALFVCRPPTIFLFDSNGLISLFVSESSVIMYMNAFVNEKCNWCVIHCWGNNDGLQDMSFSKWAEILVTASQLHSKTTKQNYKGRK